MSTQSHFEINVTLNGQHFFATDPRSCISLEQAKEVYSELWARFPEDEGWKVSVTFWQIVGTAVSHRTLFGA